MMSSEQCRQDDNVGLALWEAVTRQEAMEQPLPPYLSDRKLPPVRLKLSYLFLKLVSNLGLQKIAHPLRKQKSRLEPASIHPIVRKRLQRMASVPAEPPLEF